ncbi:7767_t:CDS:2 [Funneliformis geosporum]|uniref:7767_t:CDS:1 n=1 Tax=Funneliformis geosporum TaxID=1117311 RepID=A0A9W4WWG6_9GLOM|nr:7767_t:CDS:2 [Funneliformis geosporum]
MLTLIEECAGYTVWIHNKVVAGTASEAAATHEDERDIFDWPSNDAIAQKSAIAHKGAITAMLIPIVTVKDD